MVTARDWHTVTLLPSGKVLVTGGGSGSWPILYYLSSAELYNPINGSWTAISPMSAARDYHTATMLPSGKVLVAGGFNSSKQSSSELYDPINDSWTASGPLNTARSNHTASLLPNGKVLVAGGSNDGRSAELYSDPALTITLDTTTNGQITEADFFPLNC